VTKRVVSAICFSDILGSWGGGSREGDGFSTGARLVGSEQLDIPKRVLNDRDEELGQVRGG
jgi:hypothetical protein